MIINSDFEQDYYSRQQQVFTELDKTLLDFLKWLASFDRSYYENLNYNDLMCFILTCL